MVVPYVILSMLLCWLPKLYSDTECSILRYCKRDITVSIMSLKYVKRKCLHLECFIFSSSPEKYQFLVARKPNFRAGNAAPVTNSGTKNKG